MEPLTEKAQQLIFDFEGLDQPGDWPGGASGITIGIGYDLGYVTADEFQQDWADILGPDLNTLATVVGLKGTQAKAQASSVAKIKIKLTDAEKVFVERSAPNYAQQTAKAFPGVDALPADAQGALISLVYNRGTSMNDSASSNNHNRSEMRAIRDIIANDGLSMNDKLTQIAAQLRSMKRLWEGQGMAGLLKRREAEAQLVESCIVVA
jgi:GH24 family phage-related lysozyme (muramidase)